MGEWEYIRITSRDTQLSEQPSIEDSELSRQFFTLSDTPPQLWVQICNGILIAEPGRRFRKAEVNGRHIVVRGGPNVFTERDARHLKDLVDYSNRQYRESLVPPDLSGLDAFDR